MDGNAMKAAAKAFLTEFSGGDRTAAWARTSDDFRWVMNQHDVDSGARLTFDRAQYSAMVEGAADLFPNGISLEVTDALADGNRVALEVKGHGELADGRVYANHYIFTFRFSGERITEITEYLDTAYAQAALSFVIQPPA